MQLSSLFANETVRSRLINTFFYLSLYFIGLNIILPFVPPEMTVDPANTAGGSLADLLNAIQSQSTAAHNVSILAVGVSAYYLASIIAALIIPFLYYEREENEQSIRRLIKGLTLVIALLQAFSYSQTVSFWFFDHSAPSFAMWSTWIILTAGALICMWIADKISAQRLMDGRILLMCVQLFSGFPSAFVTEISSKMEAGKLLQLGIELCVWFFILAAIIGFTQVIRYLPLKIEESQEGEKLSNPTLRVHLNMADEYPLALANQFIPLPLLIFQAIIPVEPDTSFGRFLIAFSDPTSLYSLVFTFGLVMLATFVVVRIMLRPRQYLAFLNQWNASISGVSEEQPGRDFFRKLFDRLSFSSAIILATIAILPGIALLIFDITPTFGAYFGGYSLFILISLVTDFYSKIEQMALETSSVVGRSTTPDLGLAYELEFEYEEERAETGQ